MDTASLALGILCGAFVMALLLCCCLAVAERRQEAAAFLAGRDPIDGRFCGTRGCGGRLEYKQRRVMEGGAVVFLTAVLCPFCGASTIVHEEPDYQRLRAPGED
jgi:hypothetical protein